MNVQQRATMAQKEEGTMGRKIGSTIAAAVVWLIVVPGMALADATYPPSPPPHHHSVPPGPPTAFTGAEISKPVLILGGFVVLGLIALIGSMMFVRGDR